MSWLKFGLPFAGPTLGFILLIIGVLILIFPRIINYLIGIALIISGIMWIIGGVLAVGNNRPYFRHRRHDFPQVLNYLVGIYLIIIGIGQIISSGFVLGLPLVVGALTLIFGIIVIISPSILNLLVAIIFIIQGVSYTCAVLSLVLTEHINARQKRGRETVIRFPSVNIQQ